MQTFKVNLWESMESPPQEPCGGVIDPGFRAPGRIILVVQHGTGLGGRPTAPFRKLINGRSASAE